MKIEQGKRKNRLGRPRLTVTKEKTTLTLDINVKRLSNRLAFNRGLYLSELIENLLKNEIRNAPELKGVKA